MSNWYERWKHEYNDAVMLGYCDALDAAVAAQMKPGMVIFDEATEVGPEMFEAGMKYTLKIDENEVGSTDSREEAESLYESVFDEMNAGRQAGTELSLWASEKLIRSFTSL